jgi:hypothetical protein
MSQKIEWKDFTSGWVPSDNEVNGRKNGLIQMDNVDLDENGVLSLTGGANTVSAGYGSTGNLIFSRFMGGARVDYVHTTNGTVYRNGISISSGGLADNLPANIYSWAAFSTAFDYVIYCTGSVRKKDTGVGSPINLGIAPATDPPTVVVSAANAPFANVGAINNNFAYGPNGGVAIISSGPGAPYQQITTDVANGEAVIQSYWATPVATNLNNLQGTGSDNIGYATDRDTIILAGYVENPFGKSLQFDVLLYPGDTVANIVPDYYTYVVRDLAKEAVFNTDGSFSIRMKRIEFIRNGGGLQGWSTVFGYRITYKGLPGEKINLFGHAPGDPMIRMIGGDKSQDGTYQYMQINVNKNNSYIGKSSKGKESLAVDIKNGQAMITPRPPTDYDGQCNEVWIYRKGGALDAWYRVMVTSSYVAQADKVSDDMALKINIKWNENLVSISSTANGVPDNILSIVGPIEGRWYYFTNYFMYPSEINNPDLVDASIAIRLTGSNVERFMWAFKVAERTVLIGTTVDVYTLTGTFITQPDFTVDIYYDGVGCECPPITYTAVENSDGVFYLAMDGWRLVTINGHTSTLTVPNTNQLYDKKVCHGYQPPNLNFAPGSIKFPVCIIKNRLWCAITGTDRVEVYDFARKYWRVETFTGNVNFKVTALHATQDCKLLAFFDNNVLCEIDSQVTRLWNLSAPRQINIKSLVFDGDLPYQRKDSMILKIKMYTGGGPVNIYITSDNGAEVLVATINTAVIEGQEINIDLSALGPPAITKTYQFRLTGFVPDFKLIDAEIWFEPRPVPVSFQRFQSLNYGNVARKRLYSIPFVVDTTNNNVVFTPIVDGIAQTPMTVSCNYKEIFNYKSVMLGQETDIIGRDFEYTLHASGGTTFEFFELPQPRVMEVLPDPIKSFVIPQSNFGTTSRKRLRVIRFIMDTLGNQVKYTPVINGVDQTPTIYTTGRKQTLFHYFTSDQIGVDWAGRLEVVNQSTTFELYEVLPPQEDDIEVFPDTVRFHIIPPNNYGTDNKKYLRSLSMIIDTHNQPVKFTPIVDGVEKTPTSTFTTPVTGKDTVVHYFTDDNIGVDYGGRLESLTTEPFELWGVLPPGDGDVTPVAASALYYRVLETNFGSPNKKRVRVWPFVINTHGQNVAFYPYVDCQGVAPESIFNTNCKKTVWHFFNSDVFGVDYGGVFIAQGNQIFDLWEVVAPDIVQVLPIARRFDQVGPQELFRYGKIKQMEIRVLPFNEGDVSSIPVVIYFNDNTTYETEFIVDNNKEASYFLGVPKGTAGNIVRIELGPTGFNFHRFYMRLQAARSGFQTELEWVSLETGTHQTS